MSSSADLNVKNYGAVGDGQLVLDAVVTSGSKTVTSPSANFKTDVVGKTVWANNPATGATILAPTTISQWDSPTQIRTVAAATGTTSAASLGWGTDDTVAFKSAFNDAIAAQSLAAITRAGRIYAPAGCYMLSDRWYNNLAAYQAGKHLAPSFCGDGTMDTTLLLSPGTAVPGDGTGLFMQALGVGADFRDFRIHGGYKCFSTISDQDIWRITQASHFNVEDVRIEGIGGNTTSAAFSARGTGQSTFQRMTVVNTLIVNGVNIMTAMNFVGVNGCQCRDNLPSNWQVNLKINGGGTPNDGRAPMTSPLIWQGYVIDEGGFACMVFNGGGINLIGTSIYSGLADPDLVAVSVDGTSKAWIDKCSLGRFGAPGPGAAIRVDSGGEVFSTMTTYRGNVGGAAKWVINNGTFHDFGGGGNDYRLYSDNTNYTAKTAAQAFIGNAPVT